MDADFSGFFTDIIRGAIDFWNMSGPTGHAAIIIGALLAVITSGGKAAEKVQDRQRLAQEIADRMPPPKVNPWG